MPARPTIEAELAAARQTIREYQAEIERLQQEPHEPVAIVGIGLRLPGGNGTPGELAGFLGAGRSAIGPVPLDRWNDAEYSGAGGSGKGRTNSAGGGFLAGIDQFDAGFFNISPKEAHCIDPQQRLVLETSWEALENANIDPTRLRHGDTGVYFGASALDYAFEFGGLAREDMDGYLAAGVLHAAVPGRLSYFLGLRGPCISTDTACSSSLVALHLAVTGLRRRECEIALCGGVSAIHHPSSTVLLSDMNALAADGRCKTFDESADGYGRAEGCGVIVLKRLCDAERDGDTILAVVRGTAVRQDGESAGFTAPNGIAQEALMRAALADALLEPGDIQYIEAHGPGTALGDPIEMASIAEVFAQSHSPADPVLVGSLKTNIGHMEAAAGIGGVIKTVLQLRNATFYQHLNIDKPSSRIAWDTWPVRVPVQAEPWRAEVRRAMVNSFGFTGTIACAVLEEAPRATTAWAPESGTGHVLTISAKTAEGLDEQIRRYQDLLAAQPGLQAADLCYTTNVGRAHFRHRVSGAVASRDEVAALLAESLSALQGGQLPGYEARKTAFLFSGLAQFHPGLAAALYRRYPVFAQALDSCDQVLTPALGRSVTAIALGTCEPADAAALEQARYGQPVQFAVEYALARLWISWGVRPNSVAGHSMGEIAACAIAGLFSLADAARLITTRARLTDSVRAPGCMVSVGAGADEVIPLLAGHPDVSIAAINAPQQCVISGGRESMASVTAALAQRDVEFAPLTLSHGFHSPLMAEVAQELRAELAGIQFHEPSVTIISALTGQVARWRDIADLDYWVRHVIEPVNFLGAMRALDGRGKHVFIEIGPVATLTSLAKRCVPARRHAWLASMHPSDPDGATILDAVARAYLAGLPVSWPDFHQGQARHTIELPTYPFQRKRYWLPVRADRKAPGQRTVPAAAEPSEPALDREALAGPGGGPRRAAITELVREKVAAALKYQDTAEVGEDAEFTDLGMDSLMAVQLCKALSAELSVSFPAPVIFQHPSPRQLAEFLDQQLDGVQEGGIR
jgi:acyl transferase domain-containing protein